eukprot:4079687-Amphidinium_carterae.1
MIFRRLNLSRGLIREKRESLQEIFRALGCFESELGQSSLIALCVSQKSVITLPQFLDNEFCLGVCRQQQTCTVNRTGTC